MDLAREAMRIWRAGLAAVEPGSAVRRVLGWEGGAVRVGGEVLTGRRVWLLGAGKAAAAMARAVVEILPVDGGLVVSHVPAAGVGVPVWCGDHPFPGAASAAAAGALAAVAGRIGPEDLVIVVLSGGASALVGAGVPGVELAEVTRVLLGAGLPIGAVNTVRRHVSVLGGGGLAELLAPARVRTLVLSDVAGDVLHDVGSGPTVGDPTTRAQAVAVLRSAGLGGLTSRVRETPDRLPHARALVVGSAAQAAAAAVVAARQRWEHVQQGPLDGEARDVGRAHAAWLRSARGVRVCAGETTVTLGDVAGAGGRNQEVALACAVALDGGPGGLLALGTDGRDGPTELAGAWVDGSTARRAREAGYDPVAHLVGHDAEPLLRAVGAGVVTGPTGTNVADLHVLLRG